MAFFQTAVFVVGSFCPVEGNLSTFQMSGFKEVDYFRGYVIPVCDNLMVSDF